MRSVQMSVIYAVLITIALSTGAVPAAYAQDSQGPEELLRNTTDRILTLLNEQREEFTADPSLLEAVITNELIPLIDLHYSSRLILGRSGRGVSDDQLDAFSQAMSHLLTSRYADGLLRFNSSEQIEIMPLRGKNTDKLTRIKTRVKLPSGQFTPVDYAFRKTENGWKVFDVSAEGISYVITLRNQISPAVDEKGIDQVTADLLVGNIEISE